MIIAEVGLNHLGKIDFVNQYIDALIETSTDAITFQVREPEFYIKKWNGYDLRLNQLTYSTIAKKIHSVGKKMGIAIGNIIYLDFFESIGVDFYKVIRNDITNLPLIDKLTETGKKIIVSTGLSSEKDIDNFVRHIGKNKNFVLNHTQLSYEVEDCNLSAIEQMKSKYNLDISFGSHCRNYNVLYVSLAYNPSDILFYVRLDEPKTTFPDHKHAILLQNVDSVVENLRILALSVGDGKKQRMKNKLRGE